MRWWAGCGEEILLSVFQPRRRRRRPGLTHKMTVGIHGEDRYCQGGPSEDGGPPCFRSIEALMKARGGGLNSEAIQGHSGWLGQLSRDMEFGSLAVTASQVFGRESLKSEVAHG